MIATIGLDLAKNVFQVHAADRRGNVVMRKQLRRGEVARFFADTPPCVVAMEACCSAHHWARKLQTYGHEVKLIAPQFVRPYVKSQKNDAADAEAICEAATRPTMRFVPIKSIEQQAILSLHRVRQSFVQARTAQSNQLRSLLGEYGIVLPAGLHQLRRIPDLLDRAADELPALFRRLMLEQLAYFQQLHQRVAELEAEIRRCNRSSPACRRLASVPGIGPITATALVASIGDAASFKNGRQLAAWLGLVPRQRSSGGKPVLLGVTKRGDSYLRTLLVHGARSVIVAARKRDDYASRWLGRLAARRHVNIAIVAQANKTARIAWAVLRHRDTYDVARSESAAA